MNEIEEIKVVLDQLIINNVMNTVTLKVLTETLWTLSAHLCPEDEEKSLRASHYHTLYERMCEQFAQLDSLYNPAKAHFELLNLKSFVDNQLKE